MYVFLYSWQVRSPRHEIEETEDEEEDMEEDLFEMARQ